MVAQTWINCVAWFVSFLTCGSLFPKLYWVLVFGVIISKAVLGPCFGVLLFYYFPNLCLFHFALGPCIRGVLFVVLIYACSITVVLFYLLNVPNSMTSFSVLTLFQTSITHVPSLHLGPYCISDFLFRSPCGKLLFCRNLGSIGNCGR